MKCPGCNAEIKDDLRFCTQCGNPLYPFCLKCYAKPEVNDLFCGGCGIRLAQPAERLTPVESLPAHLPFKEESAYEAERKNVTVLFADISGFTSMSEMLDPEDVTQIMNDCLKIMADIVVKYEGYVDKFIGDCTMAVFGAPVTHENDPELAVRTALEMRRAIEDYNSRLTIFLEKPLTVHIGINSGIVIAGGMGCDKKMEYTVMGDTVNLASRLESIAGNGRIYVSAYTYNLTRNVFEYNALEPILVKGKKEPVAVYEVIRAKPIEEQRNKSIDTSIPLVGRTQELGILKECAVRFLDGHGQAVFLVSNLGIGKSRIQVELKKHFKAGDVQFIEGVCHSFSNTTSYAVFLGVFRELLDIDSEDVSGFMSSKLVRNIPLLLNQDADALTSEMREAIVFIGLMLGLELGDQFDIPLAQMDAQDIKFCTFRAVGWFFKQLTRRKPVVLIFDNLHHADIASIEMLTYLLEALKDDQIFMLFLMRPQKEHPSYKLPLIAGKILEDDSTDIICKNMTQSECEEFICYLLKVEKVPQSVFNLIWNKSEGNPLFIEEMVSNLLDHRYVEVDKAGILHVVKALQALSIPSSIQGLIIARIDKLSNVLKEILHVAAVIGPVFKQNLLGRVVSSIRQSVRSDAVNATVPNRSFDIQLDDQVNRLIAAGLVFESHSCPEIEYGFRNPLIQEAVYSTLLQKKRIEYHAIVARELAFMHKDRLDEYVEILTHHFHKAHCFEEAYAYAVKSGYKAKGNFANLDAAGYFNLALQLAQQTAIPPKNLSAIHIALSEIYELMGKMDAALDAWEKAMSGVDDVLRKADAMRNMGRIYEKQGTKERAIEIYNETAEMLKNYQDTTEMGMLLMNQSWVLNRLKKYDDAVSKADSALAIFEKRSETDHIAQVFNNLAVIYESKGEFSMALEYNLRSLKLFKSLGNPRREANVLISLGLLHNKKKEYKTAINYFEQALDILRKIGNLYGVGSALLAKGRCYLDMGKNEIALNVLRQALKIHNDLKLKRKSVANALALCKVLLRLGDMDTLTDYLKQAKKIAREYHYIAELAKIFHLEAGLLAKAGRPSEHKLLEAIDLYRQIGRDQDVLALEAELSGSKGP